MTVHKGFDFNKDDFGGDSDNCYCAVDYSKNKSVSQKQSYFGRK